MMAPLVKAFSARSPFTLAPFQADRHPESAPQSALHGMVLQAQSVADGCRQEVLAAAVTTARPDSGSGISTQFAGPLLESGSLDSV